MPHLIERMPAALAGARDQARGLPRRRRMLQALQTPAQEQLVEELRADFRRLQAGQAAHESAWWTEMRRRLTSAVLERDPRRFLAFRPILQTMFAPSQAGFVAAELDLLRVDPQWGTRWAPALEEDPAGTPLPLPRFPASSANLVHHAYHASVLGRRGGRPLDAFGGVVEYGGGYGSFARLAFRLGFRGDYHLHDFPEFCALQHYYLRSVAETRGVLEGEWRYSLGSTVEAVPPVREDDTLFVALWSLSETPPIARDPWIEVIARCSHVLIAFQERFEDADNVAWFGQLAERLPRHSVQSIPIAHSPGNHYFVAVPRTAAAD